MKIDISKDGYNTLLNKIFKNLEEERNLALDRYRIQDETVKEPTDFVLQGKEMVAFLKLASDRTDTMLALTKDIKDITFANQLNDSSNTTTSDDERKELEDLVKELKNKNNIDDFRSDNNELDAE